MEFAELRYGGKRAAVMRGFGLVSGVPINLIIMGWGPRAMVQFWGVRWSESLERGQMLSCKALYSIFRASGRHSHDAVFRVGWRHHTASGMAVDTSAGLVSQ